MNYRMLEQRTDAVVNIGSVAKTNTDDDQIKADNRLMNHLQITT